MGRNVCVKERGDELEQRGGMRREEEGKREKLKGIENMRGKGKGGMGWKRMKDEKMTSEG